MNDTNQSSAPVRTFRVGVLAWALCFGLVPVLLVCGGYATSLWGSGGFLSMALAVILFIAAKRLLRGIGQFIAEIDYERAQVQRSRRADKVNTSVLGALDADVEPEPFALFLRPFSADHWRSVPNPSSTSFFLRPAYFTQPTEITLSDMFARLLEPSVTVVGVGDQAGSHGAGMCRSEGDWQDMVGRFVKVVPVDYRKALEKMRNAEQRDTETTPATEEVF